MTVKKLKARTAAKKAAKAPLRPIDQALANERELGLKVNENASRLADKFTAFRAKKTYEPPRRDLIGDRDIFEEIQRSLRGGHGVRMTGQTPPPVTSVDSFPKKASATHLIIREENSRIRAGRPIGIIRRTLPVHLDDWVAIDKVDKARRRRGELEKTLWVPHWDRTGHWLKTFAWSMAIWSREGSVMSVNIGEKVTAAATRDRRGFAIHMRERLKRELSKAAVEGGFAVPEFFFVVEASELGRPHLHGGIELPADKRDRAVIRHALRVASHGRSAVLTPTGREVDLRTYDTPAIWANYAAKWARGSQGQVDGTVFAATSGLRSAARSWYQNMRADGSLLGGHEAEASLL